MGAPPRARELETRGVQKACSFRHHFSRDGTGFKVDRDDEAVGELPRSIDERNVVV